MKEAFWVKSRDHKMLSILEYNPLTKKGENLVILVHGFGATKVEPHRMYVKLSKQLVKMGFSVLRFDFVGSGDSDGDFEEMTISSEIEDTFNIIDYCKNTYEIKKLFLLGFSMGGCVAACVGPVIDCDGLILWSPVSDPYNNFLHILGEEKFNQGLEGNNIDYLGDVVGYRFIQELKDINPLIKAKDYKKPVLIIHGTNDQDVLLANGDAYAKNFPNSTMHYVIGADHCYNSNSWENELLKKTTKFLQEV